MGLKLSRLFSRLPAGTSDTTGPQGPLIEFWEGLYRWMDTPEYDYPLAFESPHDVPLAGVSDREPDGHSEEAPSFWLWASKLKTIREWIEGSETYDPDLAYSLSPREFGVGRPTRSGQVTFHNGSPPQADECSPTAQEGHRRPEQESALASIFAQNPRPRLRSSTFDDSLTFRDDIESLRGSPLTFSPYGPKSMRIRETRVSGPRHGRSSLAPLYTRSDGLPNLETWERSVPKGAHSCAHCQLLFIDTMGITPTIEHSSRILGQREICEAATDGCTLFQWLRNLTQDQEDSHPDSRHFFLSFIPKEYASDDVSSFNLASNNPDEFDHTSHGDLGVYADTDDPAAKYISGRPLITAVGSNDSIRRSRKWLARCHKSNSHAACRGSNRGYIPERVIRIDGDNLSLFEPSGNVPGKYAVLSYSWGGDQPYKTTTANRLAHRKSIPFNRLSKTIQDAIVTTRHLRLRYLWVDCLCVVQDDKIDQIDQIKKLPDIFQGAYVTISAASAISSTEGFLHDRHPEIVRIPYMLPDGHLGALNLFREMGASDEPIHTRAWTLQEHVHSCRILEYGSQQLRMICRGPSDNAETTYGKFDPATFDKEIWGFNPDPQIVLSKHWRPLVEHYTGRSLTYPTDRPLAILGIAREYAKVMKSDYVEGLWKRYLYQELLWHRDVSQKPQSRHSNYIAPSWSWLSLDGTIIKWRNCESDLVRDEFEIDDSHLSDRWLGHLGGADTGALKVTGYLRKALWVQGTKSLVPIGESNDTPVATIIPDADEPELLRGDIEVWCLVILRNSLMGVGLAMVQTPDVNNGYRRVGLFSTVHNSGNDRRGTNAVVRWLRDKSFRKIRIL